MQQKARNSDVLVNLPFLLVLRYAFRARTSLPVLRVGNEDSNPAQDALADTKSSTYSWLVIKLHVQWLLSVNGKGFLH